MTNETLTDMWKSNEEFHQRFLGRPAKLTEALNAHWEEVKEFQVAATQTNLMDMALEAADELYTIIGVLRACGVTEEMFLFACQSVINKNNAKTHETHYINDKGKIQRKGRE